jgi:flagellar hook-associated protein 1 FlgK
MPGLNGVLDMAKWATLSQQANIEVVAHNIANVNTPGFSRQKVVLETGLSITTALGQMGTGVRAVAVHRAYDKFISSQLNFETQMLGYCKARDYNLLRAEEIFNEAADHGLSTMMGEFWNAWQALAVNPRGQAERVGLLSTAEMMAEDFNKKHGDLYTLQKDINSNIKGAVNDINGLVDQIVELNERISSIELGKDNANDFRDQRDVLLDELAEKIGISYFEDSSGQAAIFLENGNPLVEGRIGWHVAVQFDPANHNFYKVMWDDGAGGLTDLTARISRGELSGLIEMRDTTIPAYLKKVDQLAAGIIREVNKLHYNGYGLDGSTENNFFEPLTAHTGFSDNNTGGASVDTGAVYDTTGLTLADYEIRFTGAATFEIYNATDATQVMTARINGVIDNDGTFAYTSGSAIEFEGIRVAITDGAGGPASGDIFTVNTTEDAAKNMAVNQAVAGDAGKIAAAEGNSGNDNLNAQAIAALRDGNYMNNATTSFGSFYNGLVGEIGVKVESASRTLVYTQSMVDQLNNRKQSVSGVNLDEEMASLVKFQQSYTAAAKVIVAVDEMLEELLDII